MSDNMIDIKGITKHFYPHFSLSRFLKPGLKAQKPVVALDNVSFSLEKGRVLAILGPNGSGKTTLLKIISTLILPDKGTAAINGYQVGKDDDKIKSLIGLVSSAERGFYWRLSGRQNLEFFAALYGLRTKKAGQRIYELLALFNVDYADRRFDSYSSGMKHKFALMRALLCDPPLLLLDEPTKSLDYNSACELREFIKARKDHGITTVIATHDLEEARYLAESYLILNKGAVCGMGEIKTSSHLTEMYLNLTKNA
jgi:ABC-2 type transport system ATP-binding protein